MAGMVSIASAADTIVVSMKGPGAGNPFWAAVQRGAEERGKELGVNVVVLAPPTESDVAAQIAQIEDQLAKGVKGIVLAPTDPNALAPVVDEAIADGVPVVFVDTKGIDAGVTYIGTDNKAGAAARGTPKLLEAPGHMFTDTPEKCLSLISLASITDLERVMRADVDPRRFRADIYFEDAPALGRVRLDRQGDRDRSGALAGHGTHRPLRGDQRQSDDRGPRHERRQAALGTKRGFGHIDMGVYAEGHRRRNRHRRPHHPRLDRRGRPQVLADSPSLLGSASGCESGAVSGFGSACGSATLACRGRRRLWGAGRSSSSGASAG
jgi:hypothetical protein